MSIGKQSVVVLVAIGACRSNCGLLPVFGVLTFLDDGGRDVDVASSEISPGDGVLSCHYHS